MTMIMMTVQLGSVSLSLFIIPSSSPAQTGLALGALQDKAGAGPPAQLFDINLPS